MDAGNAGGNMLVAANQQQVNSVGPAAAAVSIGAGLGAAGSGLGRNIG